VILAYERLSWHGLEARAISATEVDVIAVEAFEPEEPWDVSRRL
jgi:hypothetical protein